jgi:type I restriction enzyme M protein
VRTSIEATEWVIAAVRNDYNLSPSRYVSVDGEEEVLPLEEAEEERVEADKALREVLAKLGLSRG